MRIQFEEKLVATKVEQQKKEMELRIENAKLLKKN